MVVNRICMDFSVVLRVLEFTIDRYAYASSMIIRYALLETTRTRSIIIANNSQRYYNNSRAYRQTIPRICYNTPMKTYHYTISGRVQGVCFRHYTIQEAEKRGVSGTVRNLANGDVEVFAQGDESSIASFEQFLHIGPRSARIVKVEKEILDIPEIYRGFEISW